MQRIHALKMNSNFKYEQQSDAGSVRSFQNTENRDDNGNLNTNTRSDYGNIRSFRDIETRSEIGSVNSYQNGSFQYFRNPDTRSEISSNRSYQSRSEIGNFVHNNCARWAAQLSTHHDQQESQETRSYSYAEKRIAGLILKRQNEKRFANPTPEWLEKLRWAKQVLPNLSLEWSRDDNGQTKRQYTKEVTGAKNAKRARLQPRESFVEMAKTKMLLGVLDQGQPDDRVLRSHWKWIETALAPRCFELLRQMPGPPPCCKDVGWYQGNIKVIACDNSRSVQLYKAAVARVGEVYPGAKLVALDWCELPSKPRARIWIPTSLAKPEVIINMLQRCNPQLPTHDWRVVKIDKSSGPTCQAVLKLNRQSLAPIRAANEELNFGFSSVPVRIYKADMTAYLRDTSSKPNAPNLRSTTTAFSDVASEISGYCSNASTLVRGFQSLSYEDNCSVILDDFSNNSDDDGKHDRMLPPFN